MSLATPHPVIDPDAWDSLRSKVVARAESEPPRDVFGKAARDGVVYRWGWAASVGQGCDDDQAALSRLAAGEPRRRKRSHDDGPAETDLADVAERFLDTISGSIPSLGESQEAVLWAAAMPELCHVASPAAWFHLVDRLVELRDFTTRHVEPFSPIRLLIGAELGLTLAWRLKDLPPCAGIRRDAIATLDDWFRCESESVAGAVRGAVDARLTLASLIRCHKILQATSKRRWKRRQVETAAELATWVAAMTLPGGNTAFRDLGPRDVRDDVGPDGLLRAAVELDETTLGPAVSAALGESRSGGRLAWQVALPESMLACEEARLALLLPEWDVRRGRTHLDYTDETCDLELFGGRPRLLCGPWEVAIEVAAESQAPCGDWTMTCEYTDDDVHYVELEQPWTGDLVLQRQVLLLRDDRCVLLADAVITGTGGGGEGDEGDKDGGDKIVYEARVSLDPGVSAETDAETRELLLRHDGKHRGLVLPLAAAEWRVGPSPATIECVGGKLLHRVGGVGRVYAPLWIDLQTRRLTRKRTWRQLTVGDELRVVGRHEAVGYRIQMGSEQWMIYRSLADARCRTVLGKHLLADFLCTRFDMGDGSHEDLITVDAPDVDG